MFLRITSGLYGGLRVSVPETEIRPTEEKVRAAIFNILFSMVDFEESSFADLFAGSGAVGIEALSRGFSFAGFFDNNKKTVANIRKNLSALKIKDDFIVVESNSFTIGMLIECGRIYDVIFIDPPYKMIEKIPALIEEIIANRIVSENGIIIVETGAPFAFVVDGFGKTEKKYGNTFLNFYRKNNERN